MQINQHGSTVEKFLDEIDKQSRWRKEEDALIAEIKPWLLQRKMLIQRKYEYVTAESIEFIDETILKLNDGIKQILGL